MISLQNTTIIAMLNTTTQLQNTTTLPNIFNITSQLMRMIRATAGGSNPQNNATSNVNIRGGHFSHFEIIGANLFRKFKVFGNNNNNLSLGNNNNNNLPPPLLPLSEFRKDLGGDFNSPLGGNAEGLNSNIAALVNTLTGANLGINHVERESNYVKPTEFEGIEAEDPNE